MGSSWRRFRVAELRPGHWYLQTLADGDWLSLYRFELLEYGPMDCEVGHFYSHRHPEASFVNRLVVSLILDGEVRSLQDREYRVIRPDGVEVHSIAEPDVADLLAHELGVRVTPDEARRLLPPLP